jgi:ATP-dependent DNA ligase
MRLGGCEAKLQAGNPTRLPYTRSVLTIPAPMQAPEPLRQPFTDPQWQYELKFDGYRCMAAVGGSAPSTASGTSQAMSHRVELQTKSGAHCNRRFPELVEVLAVLPGGPHVLDREACVLRPDGVAAPGSRVQYERRGWLTKFAAHLKQGLFGPPLI